MTALEGTHEHSVIGATTTLAFGAASARAQLVADLSTAPTKFVLYTDEDVYLKQGGSSVTASSSDFLLKKGSYVTIIVDKAANSYIAAIESSTAGTLRITNITRV